MESLPGWEISSMPGPPPRQHEHERRYTPLTHQCIRTRRIWKYDYDAQMIFGDNVGLKLPEICPTGEEKSRRKTSPRKLDSTGERTRARCVTGAHATAYATTVELVKQNYKIIFESTDRHLNISLIMRDGLVVQLVVGHLPPLGPEFASQSLHLS